MHSTRVEPDEKRFVFIFGAFDEIQTGFNKFFIHRFHAFSAKLSGIFNFLLAHLAKPGIYSWVVYISCPGMKHTTSSYNFV